MCERSHSKLPRGKKQPPPWNPYLANEQNPWNWGPTREWSSEIKRSVVYWKRKAWNISSLKTNKRVPMPRAIKTIKSKISRYMTPHQIHRWIDVLDSITQSYNTSFHRSIKMAPRALTKNDEPLLWKLQYGSLDSRLRKGIPYEYFIYVSLSTGSTTSVGRWNTSWWMTEVSKKVCSLRVKGRHGRRCRRNILRIRTE